ncbi:MAG: hydrogenase maturation protease [Anaerolineae bacterium]|nr:hydrogenase maturation protease [Anaerolineae bacterium]
MPAHTLILGVGNPLYGDDAIGVIAVQALQQRDDLPPDVTVMDGGTEGIGLIPVMEQYQRVILVDAVPMNQPPGTIRRFTWDEVRPILHERTLSLHQSDLTEALVLAETLDCLPPEVVIFGVQPHNRQWDQPMSAMVENALPILLNALINEVRSND